MRLSDTDRLELPPIFDAHVHLRDGPMMQTVVPTIRQGGANTVYVMPNLTPPITTVQQCLAYRDRLQALDPDTTFLMSLYLHESMIDNPSLIAEAAAAGIKGIKSYPAGVTTNSSAGVVSYEPFYGVFRAMEEHNLILNLHGEVPSTKPSSTPSGNPAITVLNAESAFLPTLLDLHARFPNLRIILEHCTTAAAIAAVLACGPTVGATITAHHLYLTIDDWCNDPFSFCKPVGKTPEDRTALLRATTSGNPKFFFGSDSAPHPITAKTARAGTKTAAGCFTQGWVTQLVLGALEEAVARGEVEEQAVTREMLEGFLGGFGRRFYGVEGLEGRDRVVLERPGGVVPGEVKSLDGEVVVVPWGAGRRVWSLRFGV